MLLVWVLYCIGVVLYSYAVYGIADGYFVVPLWGYEFKEVSYTNQVFMIFSLLIPLFLYISFIGSFIGSKEKHDVFERDDSSWVALFYIPHSNSIQIRIFSSDAYSSGNSFTTGEIKPFTIIAFASSSFIPLDSR